MTDSTALALSTDTPWVRKSQTSLKMDLHSLFILCKMLDGKIETFFMQVQAKAEHLARVSQAKRDVGASLHASLPAVNW